MNKTLLLTLAGILFLSGCTTMGISKSGLYWGKYSYTLYELKKNPGTGARSTHIAEIKNIIAKSKSLDLRVPPGIYAELGMYTLEDGNATKANEYFNLELGTYPESKAMINQVLKKD
ncbi:MAG: DUF4810 domain-containing protein [Gammaproteobacteria bacterium]|nr:DUF4810 domain-containing protein [Gammaproteobacteria bacterium]